MRTKLYIAGPMTGLPDHNYPAFHAASEELSNAGYLVIHTANPDNLEPEKLKSTTWQQWLKKAIARMMDADAIALLPGWQASKGARLEVMIGLEVGMQSAPVTEWIARATDPGYPLNAIPFDEANKP